MYYEKLPQDLIWGTSGGQFNCPEYYWKELARYSTRNCVVLYRDVVAYQSKLVQHEEVY